MHDLTRTDHVDLSRGRLLRGGLAAGGLFALGGVVLRWLPGVAMSAPSASQDRRVLNFILTLERLEAVFYAAALERNALRGEVAEFARIVEAQEREHVTFLERALGPAAEGAPRFDVADAVREQRTFIPAAIALEDTLVAAYNGQITNLTRERVRDAATIASVEARHAAWIRDIAGEPPAADTVDDGQGEDEVRRTLRRQGLLS